MADFAPAPYDAVAILSDGARVGVWYDPLSGEERAWPGARWWAIDETETPCAWPVVP